ncbi:MAG: histone deacetylase [Candidatus Sericytochromatia bacterium]|nr:histone deacetylase [Candidatus Sericytochromatia bacterium]
MNRRHFILWLGSVGLATAAGNILARPADLEAATLLRKPEPTLPPEPTPVPARPLSLVYDRDYQLYEGPRVGTFWESPTRLQAIVERLTELGLQVDTHPVPEATLKQLARAHSPRYLQYISKATFLPQDEFALIRKVERRLVNRPGLTPELPTSPSAPIPSPSALPRFEEVVRYVKAPADAPRLSKMLPYKAAALGAGGAVKAVDEVMSGRAQAAFALIRPPGHHARRARNMGFCIFNNAAVAARHAQAEYDIDRVLIVDWDVHHGNGTQEIFYNDPSVLYFSTHQENIYPRRTGKLTETGAGRGRGFNVNVPLPPYTGDDGFMKVYNELLVPIARDFKPQLIIVSAGQDAHQSDFVARMRMTENGFARLTGLMRALAAEQCEHRLVFVLEGGYNPKVAARSVETICKALQAPAVDPALLEAPRVQGKSAHLLKARIAEVKSIHGDHWPNLARSGSRA